jgi:hypothetical protein
VILSAQDSTKFDLRSSGLPQTKAQMIHVMKTEATAANSTTNVTINVSSPVR